MESPEAIDRATAEMLLSTAKAARARAYAPYSGFPVGAALLDSEGRVFPGVNVENASYGQSTCAERSALSAAVTQGARSFRAIAIAGPEDTTACHPCGSCRQILIEFAPRLAVIVAGPDGHPVITKLGDLLPEAFRLPEVTRRPEGRG